MTLRLAAACLGPLLMSASVAAAQDAAPAEINAETKLNLDLFSSIMARSARPLAYIRPAGWTYGANLSFIHPPTGGSRRMSSFAHRFPILPVLALAGDYSNGESQKSLSLAYLSANPLPGSSARFSTYSYSQDLFLSRAHDYMVGGQVGYSDLKIARTTELPTGPILENVSYHGYNATVTVARKSPDTVKDDDSFGLIPYLGLGCWTYQAEADVASYGINVQAKHTALFYNAGVATCMNSGRACFGLDVTKDDRTLAAVGTLFLRR